ncbi:hypothetical protein B7494_g4900 [Chlorociboria aeruginascens]|nr:hypothetical protein B7494_g4900 [Chlorociboria aeruginascens]
MLTCHACSKRYLRAILGDSPTILSPLICRAPTIRRHYVTESPESSPTSHPLAETQSIGTEEDRVKHGKEHNGNPKSTSENKKEDSISKYAIEQHLKYLTDPLKLADYIRKILRDDGFPTAQAIVRAASKSMSCTVSWNHLIDWQLSREKMNAALSTYNEMKKRAQIPDAHTYSIIFRGFTNNPHKSTALAKGLALYHSMLAEKSKVKPSTMHMNAVLKLCARTGNMSALWGIAAQMPEKGNGSPDSLSYTTILNALRLEAVSDFRGDLTPMQKRQNVEKALLSARRLWAEISKRWRKGDIFIDEELVCSMGHLLILGNQVDCDDVLSLVEQSMNIPRQTPRLRVKHHDTVSQNFNQEIRAIQSPKVTPKNSEENINETPVADIFNRLTVPESIPMTSSAYAKPGNNLLSLIMQALLKLKLMGVATKYWEILTGRLGVKPDGENFHAYLRLLRLARASAESVRIIQQMDAADIQVKTFRIAMASCDRDKNNPNVFANAGKLLDLMENSLPLPDVPTLQKYLEVALSVASGTKQASSATEFEQSKHDRGKQILRALTRLRPPFINLRSFLAYGDPSSTVRDAISKDTEYISGILQLARKMMGSYHLLIEQRLIGTEHHPGIQDERHTLNSFVDRYTRSKKIGGTTRTVNRWIDPRRRKQPPQTGRYSRPTSYPSKIPKWKSTSPGEVNTKSAEIMKDPLVKSREII